MTWSVVQHAKVTGTNNASTTPFDSRGTAGRAKVAVIAIPSYAGASPVPSFIDSNGNSYHPDCSQLALAVVGFRLWTCLNPIVSATHKIDVSSTTGIFVAFFAVFETDVAGAVAYDTGKSVTNAGETNNNVTVSIGSTTPTASALILAACACDGIGLWATNLAHLLDSQDYSGGANVGGAIAWDVKSTATNPSFTWGSNFLSSGSQEHMGALQVVLDGQATPSLAITTTLATNEGIPHDLGQTDLTTASATVQLDMTYNAGLGTPGSVRLQILRTDGSTVRKAYYDPVVTPTFSGGSANGGKWRLPVGSFYRFRVQTYTGASGGGSVIETSSVTANTIAGVGPWGDPIGQSHLSHAFDTASSPPSANALALMFDGTTWSAPAGNGMRRFQNVLIAATAGMGLDGSDIPWFLGRTDCGGAGWSIDGGSLGAPNYTGGVWNDTSGGANPFKLYFKPVTDATKNNIFNYGILCGGSSDAILNQGFSTTYAGMVGTWGKVLTYIGATNAQVPAFVMVNATDTNGNPTFDTDVRWMACIYSDLTFIRDQTNAKVGCYLGDLAHFDGYHLTAAAYERAMRRVAQSVLKYYGLVAYDGGSFSISRAARAMGSNDIYLQAVSDRTVVLKEADGTTDGGSLTGPTFTANAWSSSISVSGTAYVGVRSKFTNASTPNAMRNMYGVTPAVTNLIYDDSTPGGDTLGRPLLPTLDDITVELELFGVLAETLGGISIAAAGQLQAQTSGVLAKTLGTITLAASGVGAGISGLLAKTLANVTLAAVGQGAGISPAPTPILPSRRDPYDPRSDFYRFAPMLRLTRELEEAVVAQFIANGNQPLTQSQVLAITGAQPPILTGIPRLPEGAWI